MRPIDCPDCGEHIVPDEDSKARDEELEEHLEECAEHQVACEYCMATMPRKTLGRQDYDAGNCTCNSAAQTDSKSAPRSCKAQHHCSGHYLTCPKAMFHCDYNDIGCTKRVAREDLDAHYASNIRAHAEMQRIDRQIVRCEVIASVTSSDSHCHSTQNPS